MSTPLFQHDCDHCAFLGKANFVVDGEVWFFDLYYHAKHEGVDEETVIARFGGGGSYYSGMHFAAPYRDITGADQPGIPMLVEAKRRALARGLMNQQEEVSQ